MTASFAGQPADQLLQDSEVADRRHISKAIGQFVTTLHRSGFRDRNLDLRNLLVNQKGGRFVIAKIDSPRFRIVAAGANHDRLAKADWQRLLPQLKHFDVAEQANAARQSHGD